MLALEMPVWLMPAENRVVVALVLGLLVGSFLNVVICRLPARMMAAWRRDSEQFLGLESQADEPLPGLCWPGSHCPSCKSALKPWQNIPLLSFVMLRGRCAFCRERISWRYPLVEALTGALFALLSVSSGDLLIVLGGLVLTAVLVALAFIDGDTGYLPDSMTMPLLWLGLLFNLQTGHVALADAVLGAVAGYLMLWLVYWGFRLATGREGMGPGDFKLLAALGAWLGWSLLPLVLLFSSLVGAVAGLVLIRLRRHEFDKALPFGPYLAAAGWLAWYKGAAIMEWYLYGF